VVTVRLTHEGAHGFRVVYDLEDYRRDSDSVKVQAAARLRARFQRLDTTSGERIARTIQTLLEIY
jgi:hypothetical protein